MMFFSLGMRERRITLPRQINTKNIVAEVGMEPSKFGENNCTSMTQVQNQKLNPNLPQRNQKWMMNLSISCHLI